MSSILSKVESLRNDAFSALKSTREFAEFATLDEAVTKLGGQSVLNTKSDEASPRRVRPTMGVVVADPIIAVSRRISHGDAAATALRRVGRPLSAVELMSAAVDAGALIGGEKPVVNFTSTLSKDNRFNSFRTNAGYFWWFAGEPLPLSWNETEPDEFSDLLGSASSSSQEGGEASAATN